MQVEIDYGLDRLALQVPEGRRISTHHEAALAAVTDLAGAMAQALEVPIRFPALRKALIPDDRVTVVFDEELPAHAELLAPVFEHLALAQIPPAAVTLLFATEASRQRWLDPLPGVGRGATVEVHDPHDRPHLRYLATTSGGRRIYLSRSVVEADQLVVLTRRGYDPLLGYAGSEGALFPALTDEPTRRELSGMLSMAAPDEEDWPVREEAREVAWLLGTPFLVQFIDGAGDSIAHVIGGTVESSEDGEQLLDAQWRVTVAEAADTVIAGISGDPTQHGFGDLARALACAARIVRPNGRIVLLSHAGGLLGTGAEILRQAEGPERVQKILREACPADLVAALQWANGVQQASVYLLSDFPGEIAEELFTTPLENARQVQRLLEAGGTCVFLPDAHKTLAVL